MNARGAMEIIVATIGLSLGILTVVPEAQELDRLRRESLEAMPRL